MRKHRPNILFIMADQMRHDALACNDNDIINTQNIDRLSKSGVNFSNSYTPSPICVPARASITTGCYPHKCTGVKYNGGEIKPGYPLLGDELNKRGYKTYAMGKLHYLPYKSLPEERVTHGIETVELTESGRILRQFDPEHNKKGLEEYYDYLDTVGWGGYTRGHGLGNNDVYASPSPLPEEHYVDKWVVDRAIFYMEKHLKEENDKPFFMWASFPKPHSAYDPPFPYNRMYDPIQIPKPIGDISMLKERNIYLKCAKNKEYMWDLLSPEAKKVIKSYYYGLVSFQDKQVGRLLKYLEEKGIEDNTIVIYTADHGDMLGDFGIYFKTCFYNGSVKVPFMISWPGTIPSGRVSDQLVGLQDIMPTLMSLTGSHLECKVDGCDLSSLLMEDKPVRDFFVSQCSDPINNPLQQYMVTSKKWKYIYNEYCGVEELYHLEEDSDDMDNLAMSDLPEVKEVLQTLRNYLIDWCVKNGDEDMIHMGRLKRVKRNDKYEHVVRENTFGRRFY